MSTSRIPLDYLKALREIHARLEETDIVWVVTGSLGLAIKGLPITPHDIDVQTDKAGVEIFARLFAQEKLMAPHVWESEYTRSWFASFEIAGVPVEVRVDVQLRNEVGDWDDPPNLEVNRLFIQVAEMAVPTLSLEFEEDAYRRTGRPAKAAWIGQYLRTC